MVGYGQIRDEAAPPSKLALLDYVVLEVIEQWDGLSRQDSRDVFDDMAARQKALITYVAGELVIRGYPLELALHFNDPDIATQIGDMVLSPAIDHSLDALIYGEFLVEPDRGIPHYFPTSKGRRALEFYARGAARDFDLLFNALPPTYFLCQDLQSNARRYPPIELGEYLLKSVRQWYNRPTMDFRLALLQLGVHFMRDNMVPRSYRFSRKYEQLSRNFSQRVIEEQVRLR